MRRLYVAVRSRRVAPGRVGPGGGAVVALFAVVTSVLWSTTTPPSSIAVLTRSSTPAVIPNGTAEPRAILQTVRIRPTRRSSTSAGSNCLPLPSGTTTVNVNGVNYRVRTVERSTADGDVLVSIGIRVDSILLDRTRIPLYLFIGGVAVLVAAGLGWLFAGPAVRPLRRLTEHTRRLGKGQDKLPAVHGIREAEDLSEAMSGMLADWRPRKRRRRIRCRPPRISPPTRPTSCARR